MERKNRLRGWMAGGLIAIGIVTPVVMYMTEAADDPALYFQGVELRTREDGSIQALFSINVRNQDQINGASFDMDYNAKYLTPSDMTTNAALSAGNQGMIIEDAFFEADGDLYGVDAAGDPLNPFVETVMGVGIQIPYSQWDDDGHLIAMNLSFDQALPEQGKLSVVEVGEKATPHAIINTGEKGTPKNSPVTLGYLSFCVAPEDLPLVAERFDKIHDQENPTVDDDYLIRLEETKTAGREPWQISYITEEEFSEDRQQTSYTYSKPGPARVLFTFDFPSTLIDLEPTEPTLTLDAYQLYHTGGVEDIANALRKYSPTLTATYTFGDRAHLVMPWGEAGTDYKVYQYVDDTYDADGVYTGGAEITSPTEYDPTGNVISTYLIQQYASYQSGVDEVGDPVYSRYPLPMTVRLEVTPITLTGLFAEDLHKTYAMDSVLLQTVTQIQDLRLPDQVRLQTDVPADGASLLMDIPGWTSTNVNSQWSSGLTGLIVDRSTTERWPVSDSDLTQGAGTYSFVTADVDGGARIDFAAADIRAAYPWLTVRDGTYSLETATRTLVAGGGQTVSKAENYTVSHVTTTTNATMGSSKLQLLVLKAGEHESIASGSKFRILLPDGTKLGNGTTYTDDLNWPEWLGGSYGNSSYGQEIDPQKHGEANDKDGYLLNIDPGQPDENDATHADRERLRRYINLGGWFYVSVNEDVATNTWSDYIPVYVRPRDNQHEEDQTYNFVGDNAKLFQYPGALGTTVTVPRGVYTPVNEAGETLYVDSDGLDTTAPRATDGTPNVKKEARFGVSTTYDGTTGAQPGALTTFQVAGDSDWATPRKESPTGYLKYGPDAFQHGAIYAAYGAVKNSDAHTATLRVEDAAIPAQTESVSLTYVGTGNVLKDTDGNVTLATFDTKKEDYTDRQTYTFIITNTGDTTLYDLGLDTWTDDDHDGNHFRMLRPPASFLAPGQSTTFTLTYHYDLKADIAGSNLKEYRDTLFLTSSSHPNDTDHLLQFDANFAVAKDDLYKVTVQYTPNDGAMGLANTIIGEHNTGGTPAINYDPGSSTFTQGRDVYIAVEPKDEYTIKKVTYTQDDGTTQTLSAYTTSVEVREGTILYHFQMPADDVTILVEFEEGILSKLRLSNLLVYSGTVEADLDPASPNRPGPERIFQKSFTDAELADAEAKRAAEGNKRVLGEYLMQTGSALTQGFDSSHEQYLVVIPHDATYAQVEAILREVVLPPDGTGNIKPDVEMTLFQSDGTKEKTVYGPGQGDTATPTHHNSSAFDAPDQGKSKFVDIAISARDTDGVTKYRHYYVEIHRETKEIQAVLNYGNSPVGMIWHDATITDKAAATTAFINNRYSFDGLDASLTPAAVRNATANIKNVHYWPEAWVQEADARYELETEPDAKTGQYDPKYDMDLDPYALFVYGSGRALHASGVPEAPGFTESGIAQVDGVDQIWDSSNRPVKASEVTRYVEVQVLDLTTNITQQQRFDVPTADLKARTVRIPLEGTAADHGISAGWTEVPVQERNADGSLKYDTEGVPIYEQVSDGASGTKDKTEIVYIRPGVYRLVYLFKDYDGALPVTQDRIDRLPGRPFIILPQAGDVNADGQVDKTTDVAYIKNRVSAPLGYEPYDAATRTYDKYNYPDRWVFYYRACDVNNDRNINNIDANELRGRTPLIQYYLPTHYGFIPPSA